MGGFWEGGREEEEDKDELFDFLTTDRQAGGGSTALRLGWPAADRGAGGPDRRAGGGLAGRRAGGPTSRQPYGSAGRRAGGPAERQPTTKLPKAY